MKITSNNTIQLEELYKTLRRDGQENITLDKTPVKNAMGLNVVLDIAMNIDFDVAKIIVGLYTTYLADITIDYFSSKIIR